MILRAIGCAGFKVFAAVEFMPGHQFNQLRPNSNYDCECYPGHESDEEMSRAGMDPRIEYPQYRQQQQWSNQIEPIELHSFPHLWFAPLNLVRSIPTLPLPDLAIYASS